MNVRTASKIATIAVMCTLAMACSKKVKEAPPADTGSTVGTTTPTTPTGPVTPGMYGPGDLDTDACLRQRVVYFDFDQDTLKPEFQSIVNCHAKYLRDRPSSRMALEGHADERGSREYNLGLGERRAQAVSSALQAAGGSGSQITANSYGEEKPTCTESSESCWQQNRRVEIRYSER
ncbi:peptidoglycan-associated lipoprotein Pal [Lysobacter sp. N42]|jgi:peptidoglycan-associated lipoprotein|nr:peptidoglycan-associated lipoprotein Pal [Lysobacter sp. N42]TCZ80582.1 peptidoglycan-associated lipoprotein Pal [Lysobacter sp. N42]